MAVKWITLVASPLDQLHDIHVTEPVTFLPVSWGWWALLSLIIILLVTLLKTLRSRKKLQRRVQSAQAEVNKATSLLEVHMAIRRACLVAWDREQIAHLHGQAWANFWLSTWPTTMQQDVAADVAEIHAQLYMASPDPQLTPRYQALATQWLHVIWSARLQGREARL